ncbi:antibiotic biosynthesis monooxygenase family protein [Nonomuraea polychroma]|uniref:antibiotic biosynthesis monooxygenase family protein n=1 Tax=Nonomuraea polychroma TaxID=46176 RepID=UPI003D89DFC2
MTEISTGQDVATFINVFRTEPRNQQRLIDRIIAAHKAVIQHRQGYVSTNIHASVDGYLVVDYTQWRRREDFEAMVRDPAVEPHFRPIGELTKGEQQAYEVVYCHTADD